MPRSLVLWWTPLNSSVVICWPASATVWVQEGGCVIPARATVWVQLVHCPAILEWTSPVCPNKAPRPTTGPSDGSTAKRSRQDAPHGWGGGSMSADLPRAQLVLRVLEDLNAAAVAAELQRGAPAEIGGDDVGLGCDDGEGDEGEGCCDEDLYSEGSEGREDGGGPACRWQELHELHVDVVQVGVMRCFRVCIRCT
eukprot:1159587-Pelagomonas_calceolata.AAC.1